MRTSPPSAQWLDLYRSMPKTRAGAVMDFHYAPPDQIRDLQRRWEEWALANDRRDWDPWLRAHMDNIVDKPAPIAIQCDTKVSQPIAEDPDYDF